MTTLTTTRPAWLSSPFGGSPVHWARDLALVGAATGVAAPGLVIFDPGFSLAAGLAGAVSGAALGAAGPHAMGLARRYLPLTAVLCAIPVAGALWGGFTGAFGGLFAAAPFADGSGVVLGAVFGGFAGLLQLGWLGAPYLVLSAVQARRWPLVVAACLLAPLLGWGAFAAMVVAFTPLLLVVLCALVPALIALGMRIERQVLVVRRSARPR